MSERMDGPVNWPTGSEAKPMDCARFDEVVHDLDRVGTDAALRESALVHAESCARCAQILTEVESLDLALRGVATKEFGQQAAPGVEAALLRAFRQDKAASSRHAMGWRIAAIGIAAAVLVVVGLSLYQFHRPGPAPLGTEAGPVSGSTRLQAKHSPVATANPDQTGATESAQVQQEDSDTSARFIALPYADDPQGLEGGAIVRVELSGPALASLGMPVSLAGSSGSIPADLLVSDDGTPQAIRLVSQESASQEF
jgi:hypothetical protein